ncbi:molybdopterin molybdotransferase MoeA [Chitinophaga agrisoli]|uniref:Molybdopterin molybdenumtransferase n=1 Tax=Chitinophaga agrisoli TaxID=2607653 RepID=A0A5B2VZL1_9BACT|nr:molybdopterin molybdotransferase MoeA [Chitinophaga agrisoli]KAA2244495.1 molybdopterin molybdotransferase MoeA [Chitinophaga agrisoli]
MLPDVSTAYAAVMNTVRDFGAEEAPFTAAAGRILREPVLADRPFPPYDRVMMDGIAINYRESYAKGQTIFGVEDMQAAGMARKQLGNMANCLEVMTGAVLPELTDTVVPYEHLQVMEHEGFRRFTITQPVSKHQNIHWTGHDATAGQTLIVSGTRLSPAEIGVLATVGKSYVKVARLPKVAIIATGDELVDVSAIPAPHQIRMSNAWSLAASLQGLGISASCHHVVDTKPAVTNLLQSLRDADVWICSGAVSAGKYDHLPQVLEEMGMQQIFHKVQQRPGKPFLFGRFPEGPVVFALPGNPVSGFMCFYRYLQPWFMAGMGQPLPPTEYAVLGEDVLFDKPLTYFLPVQLRPQPNGQWQAVPHSYHGSGDLASLLQADAFMELPAERNEFRKGDAFPVWRYR